MSLSLKVHIQNILQHHEPASHTASRLATITIVQLIYSQNQPPLLILMLNTPSQGREPSQEDIGKFTSWLPLPLFSGDHLAGYKDKAHFHCKHGVFEVPRLFVSTPSLPFLSRGIKSISWDWWNGKVGTGMSTASPPCSFPKMPSTTETSCLSSNVEKGCLG